MAVINVITGINGSGKTLRLLSKIEAIRLASIDEKDSEGKLVYPPTPENPTGGRQVFYYAIPGIKEKGKLTAWKELAPFDRKKDKLGLMPILMAKPSLLDDLPHGAIIVIDESHRTYPRRSPNSPVPNHVQPFDMVRHSGHEVFLCTQDSKDLDPFIRTRIGEHEHLFRAFGFESSTIWRWQTEGNPGSKVSEKVAEKEKFDFPKEVYDWYRSADDDKHVVRKTFPWKWLIKFLVIILVLLGIGVWGFVHLFHSSPGGKKPEVVPGATIERREEKKVAKPVMDAKHWAANQSERIPGMPMSAPFYDVLWKAATVPKIAGCMSIHSPKINRCTCTTQQGTTITTLATEACEFYVKNGWFDPLKPDENVAGRRATDVPSSVPLGSSSSVAMSSPAE